jgi:hypothetical protein
MKLAMQQLAVPHLHIPDGETKMALRAQLMAEVPQQILSVDRNTNVLVAPELAATLLISLLA